MHEKKSTHKLHGATVSYSQELSKEYLFWERNPTHDFKHRVHGKLPPVQPGPTRLVARVAVVS